MNLTGQLSDADKYLFKNVGKMTKNIISQTPGLRPHVKGEAVEALLACATSYHGSIGQLADKKTTSSATVFSLTRSLLESTLSILALCKDPDLRSPLYINFGVVLDWKTVVRASWHIGRVFLPDTQEYRQGLTKKRKAAEKRLRRFGLAYMKKKRCTQEDLEEAIADEKVNKFRDKWYSEGPSELLARFDLEWVYDVLYKTFCSHVHADIGSIRILGGMHKSIAMSTATVITLLGIRLLVQKLSFRVSDLHRSILDMVWRASTVGKASAQGQRDY